MIARRPLLQSTLAISLTLASLNTQAETLMPFKATFDVRVLGFNIGDAHQSMTCQDHQCLISSEAAPPKWAEKFVNESAKEQVKLIQNDHEFKWLEYKKYLTRHYSDHTEHKTYTLTRDEKQHKILYLEEKKSWPEQKEVYDVISIAYAVQYHVLNHLPLNNLYLQDDKIQQKLIFSTQNKPDTIDLPFSDDLQTQRFEFHNDKIIARLWLIPQLRFFPGQIEIENKEEDRTITLELNKLPDLNN